MFFNSDSIYAHSLFTQACKQSEAVVDFVSTYEKIGANTILIKAEIHVNFCLQTVLHTKSICAGFMNETHWCERHLVGAGSYVSAQTQIFHIN